MSKGIIKYGFFEQMGDLFFILLLSFAMGAIVFVSVSFVNGDLIKILLGTVLGILFYISIAWLFNIGEIRLLPSFIKTKRIGI